jgi:hypothetical protein
MSAAAVLLPFVWATGYEHVGLPSLEHIPRKPVEPQMAFYRKYTEAMLRRYMRMSMEAGKVPSLLGQEMFRGHVTSYRVESFEDVVISDLNVLKSQMLEVLGNGQPGRLSQLEGRMHEHEKIVQRLKGMAAAFGALLTIAHVAIDFFIGRH